MPVATTISQNILPLYLLVALGFVAGKYARVDRASIATLLFYFVSPPVFFASVAKVHVDASLLALPIITFALSTAFCFAALHIARRLWTDNTPNILALSAGTANTGYFGLPVALLLFDEQGVGMYFAAMLGMTIFESSIGFYITARGQHTSREAFIKVLKLPALYAFLAGLAASATALYIPTPLAHLFDTFRGAYIVLGMMIVGLGLSSMTRFSLDVKFTGFACIVKHALWPLSVLALIAMDRAVGHIFGEDAYRVLILLAIVPLPANSVVFATLLNAHPEKVATAVLLSTVAGLVLVPLMVAWLL